MATSEFLIEKNVPVPERHGGKGNSRFPFTQMEVGDSFYVPWGDDKMKTRSVVSNAATSFQLRNAPKKFSTRKDDLGLRVWRIA